MMAQPQQGGDLELVSDACNCGAHLIKAYLGAAVAKAMRLDTPEEFDRAVARLAVALRRHAEKPEQQAA